MKSVYYCRSQDVSWVLGACVCVCDLWLVKLCVQEGEADIFDAETFECCISLTVIWYVMASMQVLCLMLDSGCDLTHGINLF